MNDTLVLSICGITLRLTGDRLAVEGDGFEERNLAAVANRFMRFVKHPDGRACVLTYLKTRERLVDALDVPLIRVEFPALDRLTAWLRDHGELVPSVERALVEHGYTIPADEPDP